jgi:hypothetical protein
MHTPIMSITTFILLMATSEVLAQFPVERTLTDGTGRKLEATILSHSEDKIRIRRKSDQKEFDIPMDKVSAKDRIWLASLKDKPMVEPVADAQKINPLPAPKPSLEKQLPNILSKDIPQFDEQIKNIEAIAVEFENTHNLPEVARGIRNEFFKRHSHHPLWVSRFGSCCYRFWQ